jgi:hypothetical protein
VCAGAHTTLRVPRIALSIVGTPCFEEKVVHRRQKDGVEGLPTPGSEFAVLRLRTESEFANNRTKIEHSFWQ